MNLNYSKNIKYKQFPYLYFSLTFYIKVKVINSYSSHKDIKKYSNKRLNETEWQNSLIKTYKSLDEMLCISDCSRFIDCKLISFNKFNNICKYFRYFLSNETDLIESNGDFLYNYQINRYTYNLQGKQYLILTAGSQVWSLILLPNSNFASGCFDGSIKIWSTSNWILVLTLNHGSRVLSLAILQNKYLVSGGDGGLIKLWDFRTGKLINTFTGFSKTVRTIKVLNNDNLATGSWDDLNGRIWNTTSGTIKLTLYEPSLIYGFVQLKNGDLVSISTNGNINKWDHITGSLIKTKNTGNFAQTEITQLMNEDLFIGDDNGGLRIFNSTTFELKYNLIGHTNDIVRLIQLQNGDLASCSMDNSIIIWDWQSKTRKYKLTAHSNWVWGLIELPNGYLVSAGLDSKIIIWK